MRKQASGRSSARLSVLVQGGVCCEHVARSRNRANGAATPNVATSDWLVFRRPEGSSPASQFASVTRRMRLVESGDCWVVDLIRGLGDCARPRPTPREEAGMPLVTTSDGTEIFYKDWGEGQAIVFSHGWPLSGDDWDTHMLFFLQQGYRVIAHDRRGHGRSTQTGDGHDMDHYADDLAALTAHLDLEDAVHVGHSTGGGEVVHYTARHGESRVAKAVLISAVPPLMVQTDANLAACRRACSTTSRPNSPPTGPSSTGPCRRAPSMASTGPAWNPLKRSSR